jgi:very-short-patch-repair endonuclease
MSLSKLSHSLSQLSGRLVNLTRRNRSIRLLRKTKRQCVDLLEIERIREGTAEKTLQRVIAGRSHVVLSQRDCPVDPRDNRYELTIGDDDQLEEAETADYRRVRAFRSLDSNFTALTRNANLIEAETGAMDLYLTFPWIAGNCDDPDGTYLQAPLMLFPVRVSVQRSPRLEWVIQPREGAEPILNEALVLALEQYHNTVLPEEFIEKADAEAESEETRKDPLHLIGWFHEQFTAMGMRMADPEAEPAELPEFRAAEVPKSSPGFTIRNHIVLGYFPQADSALRHDYASMSNMAENGELPGVLARLLDAGADGDVPDGEGVALTMDEVPEADTCWVLPSDASQEAAMLRTRNETGLVVHGPPGTGKSQVIVNLITDALYRGQRVLLCCQKRAALDVVHQRLDALGLGTHVALVHDYSNDRRSLFDQIGKALEPDDGNLDDLERRAADLARSIDNATAELSEIARELHATRRCGYTARQLYAEAANFTENADTELMPVARRVDRKAADALTEGLRRLQGLHERAGDHAQRWSGRQSFAELSFADKARIDALLQAAYKAAEVLLRSRGDAPEGSAAKAGKCYETLTTLSVLLPSESEQITALAEIAWQEANAAATQTLLEGVARLLPELRDLPPRPGADFTGAALEAAAALELYNSKRGSLFRVFSGEWRRARDSARTYLRTHAVEDTAERCAEHAALIRSRYAWDRLDRLVGESPFGELFAGVGEAAELASRLEVLRKAEGLVERARQGVGELGDVSELALDASSLASLVDGCARMSRVGEAWRSLEPAVQALSPYLRDEAIELLTSTADHDAARMMRFVGKLSEGLEAFDTLISIDEILARLDEAGTAIFRRVRRLEGDWADTARRALVMGWLEECESESRSLRKVSTGELADLREKFRAELDRRRKLNQKRLRLILSRRATEVRFEPEREVDGRHSAERPWRDLRHQVNKKRRLWSLRRLVHELAWPLFEVMPCWLVSPETLSAAFPLKPDLFDLVIFDEASQCAVQHAIPAVYRAKRVMIAGDEQQLRPFDLFGSLGLQTDDEDFDPDMDEAPLESESVLTLARTRFPEEMLQCHYRSIYEELIDFSNQGFYQGRLLTVPPAQGVGGAPIEWRRVNGVWENRRNRVEAEAVCDLLFELLQQHGTDKSIGVITFNNTQQSEILDRIERRQMEHPEFGTLAQRAFNPDSGNKDDALFVKNIENVQGDERDIIVFSVGYGPDPTGRVRANFGTLNQEGGDNRLNVAISRSRERVIVVSSVEPEQLSVATAKNRGPRLLRSYLEYAKAVHAQSEDARLSVLRGINPALDVNAQAKGRFDSPFEEQVYEALARHNLTIDLQVGVSGYRIDLGVRDPDDPTRYILGIECDGASYHSAASARERDAYRQRFLEFRGWTIHRIWSRNWWRNREAEVQKVLEAVRKARVGQ